MSQFANDVRRKLCRASFGGMAIHFACAFGLRHEHLQERDVRGSFLLPRIPAAEEVRLLEEIVALGVQPDRGQAFG